MFCRCIILLKYQSGLCFLRSICIVSGDGMSTQVDLHILPGIRDFHAVVDILLDNHFVIAVIIYYYLGIRVFCLFIFALFPIRLSITLFIFKLFCNVFCINKSSFACCGAKDIPINLILGSLLKPCDPVDAVCCLFNRCPRYHCACLAVYFVFCCTIWHTFKGQGIGCLAGHNRDLIGHCNSHLYESIVIPEGQLEVSFSLHCIYSFHRNEVRDILTLCIIRFCFGTLDCLRIIKFSIFDRIQMDLEIVGCNGISIWGNPTGLLPEYRMQVCIRTDLNLIGINLSCCILPCHKLVSRQDCSCRHFRIGCLIQLSAIHDHLSAELLFRADFFIPECHGTRWNQGDINGRCLPDRTARIPIRISNDPVILIFYCFHH